MKAALLVMGILMLSILVAARPLQTSVEGGETDGNLPPDATILPEGIEPEATGPETIELEQDAGFAEVEPGPEQNVQPDLIDPEPIVEPVLIEPEIIEPNQDPIMPERVNQAPVITDIPVIRLHDGQVRTSILLKDTISDQDDKLETLKITASATEDITVRVREDRIVFSYLGDDTNVGEWVTLTVKDPQGNRAEKDIRVTYTDTNTLSAPAVPGFSSDAIGALESEPPAFMAGSQSAFVYHLTQGWNLISLALVPQSHQIEDVFADIEPYYTQIKVYDYSRYENNWVSYIPGVPDEAGLQAIHEGMGIWVLMTEDRDFTLNGNQILQTDLHLNKGYNLVSFPSDIDVSISTALGPLIDWFEVVYEYDPALPSNWRTYNKYAPPFLNDLSILHTGKAYWIKTDHAMTWEYDRATQRYYLREVDNNQRYESIAFIPANGDIVAQRDSGGDISYHHQDYLGSTAVVTDETGDVTWRQEYYPFGGQIMGEGEGSSIKMQGKEYDMQTGLYYFGARYFDPETGRFLQADTDDGTVNSPQTLNKYAYPYNNPIKYADPSGNAGSPRPGTRPPVYRYQPPRGGQDARQRAMEAMARENARNPIFPAGDVPKPLVFSEGPTDPQFTSPKGSKGRDAYNAHKDVIKIYNIARKFIQDVRGPDDWWNNQLLQAHNVIWAKTLGIPGIAYSEYEFTPSKSIVLAAYATVRTEDELEQLEFVISSQGLYTYREDGIRVGFDPEVMTMEDVAYIGYQSDQIRGAHKASEGQPEYHTSDGGISVFTTAMPDEGTDTMLPGVLQDSNGYRMSKYWIHVPGGGDDRSSPGWFGGSHLND